MNTIQNYFKFNFIVLLIGININAYSCPLDKKDKEIIISEFCPRLKNLKKKKSLNSRVNLLIASTEDKKSIENDAKTNFKISQKICKNAGYWNYDEKKIIKYFRVLISLFNKLYLFSDKIWCKL